MISKETAEHYIWGDGCEGWHLVKTPDLSIIQERVPPGKAELRHYHEKSRQFFFVLSGKATLELEGKVYILLPQQGLSIEPGQAHQLLNQGTEELIFTVTSCPPSHGDRVLVK